jgi:PAS domain S-box-containing protein
MVLIVIIILQILLVVISINMLRITSYRLIWVITASASGLIVLRGVLLFIYKGEIPSDTIVGDIVTIIPVLVSLLLVAAFFVFSHMYKSRLNLESTLRQEERTAKNNLLTHSTAIEQSPSIVVITNLEGNIEYVNPKFTELTGYEKDEVIGVNPRILKSDHFQDSIYEEMWNTISSGGEWRGEFHNRKKNGDLYWEAASISSIKDADGNIKHYLAVKEDITERKNIEDALKKSEKRLMDVQRAAHIGTWEWDAVTEEASWSDEMYRILGLVPGESKPSFDKFLGSIHSEDIEYFKKTERAALENGLESNVVFRLLLKDGTIKHVNDWGRNYYDSEGRHIYSTGMIQDITQRVNNEEKIKSSLEEKNALLKELYHRTKNNMQVISAMLNLSASSIDDDRVSEVFSDLDNRIQSMSLIHEKLYQSQNLSSINLKEYITDLCSSLVSSYHSMDCDVFFKFDLEDVSVLIDAAVPLGLIINELVSNSFKHAFPGREKGEIGIKLMTTEDSTIKIEIADNGIGAGADFNIDKLETIGLQTVFAIGKDQLHGNIELDTSSGFRFSLKFRNDAFETRIYKSF